MMMPDANTIALVVGNIVSAVIIRCPAQVPRKNDQAETSTSRQPHLNRSPTRTRWAIDALLLTILLLLALEAVAPGPLTKLSVFKIVSGFSSFFALLLYATIRDRLDSLDEWLSDAEKARLDARADTIAAAGETLDVVLRAIESVKDGGGGHHGRIS